jgi:uncharacterized protein YegL
MNNQYAGEDDLVTNTTARIPVCICIDTSGSMYGEPIEELQRGIEAFYEAVRKTPTAIDSCEICIVQFSDGASVLEDYSLVGQKSNLRLNAIGGTDMNAGVELALRTLADRKAKYKKNGVEYYQPWLVLMSDGEPNDPVPNVQAQTLALEAQKKLTVFAIGIGDGCDLNTLQGFTKRKALKLKEYRFEEFFEWLGKSIGAVSASQPGEGVKLDTSGISSWGDI